MEKCYLHMDLCRCTPSANYLEVYLCAEKRTYMENIIEKYGGIIITVPFIAAAITMFAKILITLTI